MTLENYPLQVYPLVPGLLRIDGVYHTWDMIPTTANCETKSLLQLALSISSEPLLAQLRVYYASLAVDFHQFLVKSSPVVAHVSLPTKRFSVRIAAQCLAWNLTRRLNSCTRQQTFFYTIAPMQSSKLKITPDGTTRQLERNRRGERERAFRPRRKNSRVSKEPSNTRQLIFSFRLMHLCSLIIAGHVSVIALLFHVFFPAATQQRYSSDAWIMRRD